MPSALVIGDVVKCSLVASYANQASFTSFYFRVATVGTPAATDQDLAQTFDGAIATHFLSWLSSQAVYDGVYAQRIFPFPIYQATQYTGSAGAGTGGGTILPYQVRGLISFYTIYAGRAGRGRAYIPFPASAQSASTGKVSGGGATVLGLLALDYLNMSAVSVGGRTCTVVPVLYNRKTGTTRDYQSYVARLGFATQRRSGYFGRPNVPPI